MNIKKLNVKYDELNIIIVCIVSFSMVILVGLIYLYLWFWVSLFRRVNKVWICWKKLLSLNNIIKILECNISINYLLFYMMSD